MDRGTQACLAVEFGQRDPTGALELHDAISGQQFFKIVELVGMPIEADGDRLDADGEDLALEDVGQLDDLAALFSADARTVASSSSRSTDWRGSSSLILTTSISLNSCLVICSSGADSTSTTMVMRLKPSSSAGATASEKML